LIFIRGFDQVRRMTAPDIRRHLGEHRAEFRNYDASGGAMRRLRMV